MEIYIVLGTDSKERGEENTAFEKKTSLFSKCSYLKPEWKNVKLKPVKPDDYMDYKYTK